MATTLKDIRRAALRGLGDLTVCTATADGGDDTFIDTKNLVGGINAYQGRDVLFTGGTSANLGQERYVISSSRQYRALGFEIALPATTALADELELINSRSIGFRFQDIHEIINICIRMVGRDAKKPAPPYLATYASDVPIPIPAEFGTVEYVNRQDADYPGRWHQIPKAKRLGGYGWSIDRGARQVLIAGRVPGACDGASIRIDGLMPEVPLYDDNDATNLDFMWLVKEVGALAALAKHSKHPIAELERTMFIRNQEAGSLMPRTTTRRSPFSENV